MLLGQKKILIQEKQENVPSFLMNLIKGLILLFPSLKKKMKKKHNKTSLLMKIQKSH